MTGRRRFSAEEKEAAVRLVRESGRTSKDVGNELGINPRTLGSWVRADFIERRGQNWARRVRPHFDFLTGHHFTLADVAAKDWWKVAVIYRSAVSAVEVALSIEFQRVELSLIRLVDGEMPAYPVFIVDSVPVDTFLADWLLELRGDPVRQPGRGLKDVEVEAQLAFWAAALRDYGADFLAGDLAVLDQLEQMIRDNARRHGPPEVEVWVPKNTETDAAAGTVARVQATIPDDVTVTLRRYRK
jgi:hypothetical protein